MYKISCSCVWNISSSKELNTFTDHFQTVLDRRLNFFLSSDLLQGNDYSHCLAFFKKKKKIIRRVPTAEGFHQQ